MADRPDDDDVIVLASFNIHRSQGRRARRRNFITISDDSDEEPVPLDPNSPVLVSDKPDDDDDVSILESLNPARRRVIRPAALWGVASEGDGPIIELKEVDGHRTAPLPPTSQYRETSAPSTSQYRDTSAPSTSQYRDTSAPSTSQYRDGDTSAPSTSTQTRHQPFTRPVLQEVKLVLLPQVQPPAPPQPQARPRSPLQQLHPGPLNQPRPPLPPQALLLTHAFQIQQPRSLHPQPVPQVAPQRCPAGPCGVPAPAVLIAAAPERLGPPETGHRITLGSQTLGGLNPQSGAPLLTHDRPLSLGPQVVVVVNRPDTQPPLPIPALAVPLNPNPIVPVPVVPVVPRTAEERAGPSDQQEVRGPETPQLQPHVRALVRGVVDLFPDVQENYVAELIQTNDLKDLNV